MAPELGCRVWQALGCRAELLTADREGLAAAAAAVDSVVAEIDRACSRFGPNSELSSVNRRAGREVRVSPLLGGALRAALHAAAVTGGAVDPTIGAAMRRIGYDRDYAQIPALDRPIRLRATPVPGWRVVEFDPSSLRLRVPPGVQLDLGSTAKALAADLAAAAAHRAGGTGVLVGLGGDLATAGAAPADGWQVRVTEDSHDGPEGAGPVVAVREGGLATSSTTVRRWRRGAQTLHHIVDPATGMPVSGGWRTVTVAAASCLDANVAATCAVVRGEGAIRWLEDRHLDARLVAADGQVSYTGRWPIEPSAGAAA